MSSVEIGLVEQETEVFAKGRRRQFTAEFKRKVLAEADACTKAGEIGAARLALCSLTTGFVGGIGGRSTGMAPAHRISPGAAPGRPDGLRARGPKPSSARCRVEVAGEALLASAEAPPHGSRVTVC